MRGKKASKLHTAGRSAQPSSRSDDAIIYCRVSDKSQVERGHGLDSQEITCREYAERHGYNVLGVLSDDFTGKSTSRDGLKALLTFLKRQRRSIKVVIDDGTRLARSPRAHIAIRDAIFTAGGKLESPKRVYADDPEDDVLEMIEAVMRSGSPNRRHVRSNLPKGWRIAASLWAVSTTYLERR